MWGMKYSGEELLWTEQWQRVTVDRVILRDTWIVWRVKSICKLCSGEELLWTEQWQRVAVDRTVVISNCGLFSGEEELWIV